MRAVIDSSRNAVYRAANSTMVHAYWSIGKLIFEEELDGKERAEYGSQLLNQLAKKLQNLYGKGFDESNLRHMRNFYCTFPKQDALRPELSWTHYRLLLKVNDDRARQYYALEAATQQWSTRALQRQINTQYFERMLSKHNVEALPSINTPGDLEASKPSDFIKDPYVLEFLDLPLNHKLKEENLETALMEKLKDFLLELGKGFSFVGRQYKVNTENQTFYIDLVFYNFILKCFVLIDLKMEGLSHKHIGQMDFYVRYFEDQNKVSGDNPTIGLILCTEKDHAIAKYSLLSESKQIFASKYKTYLPSEEELQREIERGRHQIEVEKKLKS
ncbi:MAG: YhcG family protein [Flavobacteriales bacterium]